jgi:hypothetical protein
MAGRPPDTEIARLTEGEFPFSVTAVLLRAGDDIQIYVGGGERAHIGGVAVSLPHGGLDDPGAPSCTTSVFNRPEHRDGQVAEMFAEAFCRRFRRAVCVSAGIHVDGADEADLARLLGVCEVLLERSLASFGDLVRTVRDEQEGEALDYVGGYAGNGNKEEEN